MASFCFKVPRNTPAIRIKHTFALFLLLRFLFTINLCQAELVYSSLELINIVLQSSISVTVSFEQRPKLSLNISRTPRSTWIVADSNKQRRWRSERKQKQGCQAGLLVRLKKQPLRRPLASIFLSKASSVVHNIDELELHPSTKSSIRDSCVLIITESTHKRKRYSQAQAERLMLEISPVSEKVVSLWLQVAGGKVCA